MKFCFYRTSGRNFNSFDYEIIEEFNFKNYIVKVIEFKTLNELIEFSDKIGYELILTDSKNVICYKKEMENYTINTINKFLNNYPYAIEIYDYYRE